MPSAGERHFLLPFCCRLDKKEGVWRDATRWFKAMINSRENHFWALEAFTVERARKRKVDIGILIHAVLRKEMDLFKELCW